LIFACIAAGVAALFGIGYLFLSSGAKPATRGADTSITAPSQPPGTAPAKGPQDLPADAGASTETPPAGPAKADASGPSKILPASFKDDIQDKFGGK
jgi:hypothetical protein